LTSAAEQFDTSINKIFLPWCSMNRMRSSMSLYPQWHKRI
jgi:hypothetical protein